LHFVTAGVRGGEMEMYSPCRWGTTGYRTKAGAGKEWTQNLLQPVCPAATFALRASPLSHKFPFAIWFSFCLRALYISLLLVLSHGNVQSRWSYAPSTRVHSLPASGAAGVPSVYFLFTLAEQDISERHDLSGDGIGISAFRDASLPSQFEPI
jgi:hypothetical protein